MKLNIYFDSDLVVKAIDTYFRVLWVEGIFKCVLIEFESDVLVSLIHKDYFIVKNLC